MLGYTLKKIHTYMFTTEADKRINRKTRHGIIETDV